MSEDYWQTEWRERHLTHGGDNPSFTTAEEVITRSCLHCRRQPDAHQEGKCLFDTTSYEPYGPERFSVLLKKQSDWYYYGVRSV